MCRVLEYYNAMKSYVLGRPLTDFFPADFMQNLPPDNVREGCCIACNRQGSREEMFPAGRTERAMCSDCYARWEQAVAAKGSCGVCGGYLGAEKLEAFRNNPGEVSNRLHDGKCLDYFSLVSAEALVGGTGITRQAARIEHQPVRSIEYVPQMRVPDFEGMRQHRGKPVKVIPLRATAKA